MREGEDDVNALLAEDVDGAGGGGGFVGADREEGLHGVVREGGDGGGEAEVGDLREG